MATGERCDEGFLGIDEGGVRPGSGDHGWGGGGGNDSAAIEGPGVFAGVLALEEVFGRLFPMDDGAMDVVAHEEEYEGKRLREKG